MMNLPPQTADIFKILSRGLFISSNSSERNLRLLYEVLDDEGNFELLHSYFQHIQFVLERGNEYFYFSRPETKVDSAKKIERAFEWIDLLDFFKTFDHSFGPGYRFSPSEILVKMKTDADLEAKINGLKKIADRSKHSEILDRVLKKLMDDGFVELENETTQQYKVLTAFHYLEQLVVTININEDVENEIPE